MVFSRDPGCEDFYRLPHIAQSLNSIDEDNDRIVSLVEELLRTFFFLYSGRAHADVAQVNQDHCLAHAVIQKLCCGPATFSAIRKHLPEHLNKHRPLEIALDRMTTKRLGCGNVMPLLMCCEEMLEVVPITWFICSRTASSHCLIPWIQQLLFKMPLFISSNVVRMRQLLTSPVRFPNFMMHSSIWRMYPCMTTSSMPSGWSSFAPRGPMVTHMPSSSVRWCPKPCLTVVCTS